MEKEGLSRLVVTVMAFGQIAQFDARDARDVHAAVLRAVGSPGAESLAARFDAKVSAVPDPEVGLRVKGMTQAIWGAVARGWLEPVGKGLACGFRLLDDAHVPIQVATRALSTRERSAIRQAGEAWAFASIARKNRAFAATSPAAM